MKNTLKYITLLLLAFSITLVSCEKDTIDDTPPDGDGDGDSTAKCYIKKITSSDEETTYTYNSDNQFINITVVGSGDTIDVTYNTDGTINTVTAIIDGSTVTGTYEYDAGVLTTATVISDEEPVYFTYEFTEGKLTRRERTMVSEANTITGNEIITYSGDNVSMMQVDGLLDGVLFFS